MRFDKILIPALVAVAGTLSAQQYVLHGTVEPSHDFGYVLADTNWPLKFVDPFPDVFVGKNLRMVAENVGPGDAPMIVVSEAQLAAPLLALEEFQLGTKALGTVVAEVAGDATPAPTSTPSFVAVVFGRPASMCWSTPFGTDVQKGVWLVGGAPVGMTTGFADPRSGLFEFAVAIPSDPVFRDDSYVAQAMIFDAGGFETVVFSNAVVRTLQ